MSKPVFDPAVPRAQAAAAAVAALPPMLQPRASASVIVRPQERALFDLVRGTATGAERLAGLRQVFSSMPHAVQKILDAYGGTAAALGSRAAADVAERILIWTANYGMSATSLAKFRANARGHRSNLAGALTEWYFNANRPLTADVLRWGAVEQRELNRIHGLTAAGPATPSQAGAIARPSDRVDRLVDARGATVVLPSSGAFHPPSRATDIFLMKDGRPKPFFDAMTVSFFGARRDGPWTHVAVTTAGQYKFNTAILKARRQVADDPVRLDAADALIFRVGATSHSIEPQNVVFVAQRGGRPDLNQYVVTNGQSFVVDAGRKPLYSRDPEALLSGDGFGPPQITPVATTARSLVDGRRVRVEFVLVGMVLDSRLPLSLARLVFP